VSGKIDRRMSTLSYKRIHSNDTAYQLIITTKLKLDP